jgi:hypothetical protein
MYIYYSCPSFIVLVLAYTRYTTEIPISATPPAPRTSAYPHRVQPPRFRSASSRSNWARRNFGPRSIVVRIVFSHTFSTIMYVTPLCSMNDTDIAVRLHHFPDQAVYKVFPWCCSLSVAPWRIPPYFLSPRFFGINIALQSCWLLTLFVRRLPNEAGAVDKGSL